MAEHGKKFLEVAKLVEDGKEYSPEEAAALVKKTARAKFDETVELHIRMGLDPRQATQLPYTTLIPVFLEPFEP